MNKIYLLIFQLVILQNIEARDINLLMHKDDILGVELDKLITYKSLINYLSISENDSFDI